MNATPASAFGPNAVLGAGFDCDLCSDRFQPLLEIMFFIQPGSKGRNNLKECFMTSNSKLIIAAAVTGLFAGAAARASASTAPAASSAPQSVVAPTHAQGVDAKLGQKATQFADDTKGKHDCKGKNACKGEGGCKTGDNGCKGKNSCKGKGGCSTKSESKLA